MGLGLVISAIGFIPAILILKLNGALKQLKAQARIWQIVLSCLFLLGFPIGTILYGISLYFMAFDNQTKAAFETVQ
jgi:hypothetical protein